MEQPVAPPRRYTLAEYFELEAESPDKWEFRDGEVVCMAGGSVMHALITANVARAIGNGIEGTPCCVYSEGLRVQMARRTLYGHPDVTVVCGQPEVDPADERGETIVNPRLIVEVLSPSTELYDRSKKFYRLMQRQSLQEYVLVSQTDARVDCLYRHPDGFWRLSPVDGLDRTIRLDSLGIDVPMAAVYANVTFPPTAMEELGE